MTTNLKPYPAYKDSGVLWVGPIPAHWSVVPNRAVLRRKKTLVGNRYSDYTLLSLTKRGVIPRDLENPEGKFPASFDTYQEIEPYDLVFCLFDIDETPRAVGLATQRGMVTGAYTRFVSSDRDHARFIALFYSAMDDRKLLRPLYTGLRKVITTSSFLSARMPMPPAEERLAIIQFLSRANGRIGRVIQAKRKLLGLLEEHKQVITYRALTGAIDERAARCDSGVPWLGHVPEHWDVRPISRCLESVTAGLWGDEPTDLNEAEHVVCVRVADFDMDQLQVSPSRLTIRAIPAVAQASRLLRPGDLLIEKSGGGDAQPVGRAVLFDLDRPAVTSNFVSRLRVRENVIRPRFLLLILALLQSRRLNMPSIKQTTGIQNLDEYDYFSTRIAVPPLHEQDALLDWIDRQTGEMDKTRNRARREVELLREYRARLTADVVTGKLDVRQAAAGLPDLVDQVLDDGGCDEAPPIDEGPEPLGAER